MPSALFVVSEEGYWGEECTTPLTMLSDAGVEITVATPSGSPPVIDERSIDPDEVGEETAEEVTEIHESDERLNDPISVATADATDYDLVAFPGGYGTLDELFEVLTLVQTRKMQSLPIILFGREFWNRAIDFDFLVDEGMISLQDRALFRFVETAEQAVSVLKDFYGGHPPDEPVNVQGHDMKGDR